MSYHEFAQRWCNFAVFLIFFCYSTRGDPDRYPIGSRLDRGLPYLGSTNSHLPSWVQRRGFYDPGAQIQCVGPVIYGLVPDYLLAEDWRGEFPGYQDKPNLATVYHSMTELCAKTAYEGSYTAWTAGGYCAMNANPPTVVFEKLPPGSGPMPDIVKTIFLACQHSCHCLEGDSEKILAQGRPNPAVVAAQEATSRDTGGVANPSSNLTKPLEPRARLHSTYPPPSESVGVNHIPVYFIPEVDARRLGPAERITESNTATTVWFPPPDDSWAPECTGDSNLAAFGLPTVSAQEACAADWYGGNLRGNAGYVCLPPTDVFPQAHIQRIEYVGHPAFRGAVMIQPQHNIYSDTLLYCFSECKCIEPKKPRPASQPIIIEGVFDAAKDFINGVCRVGQITSAVKGAFSCKGVTGSSRGGGGRYRTLNKDIRRNQLCSTQKVNGFDLAASLAAQYLCYETSRGIRTNSPRGGLGR